MLAIKVMIMEEGARCGESTATIHRTSSIENEPRTLHINQIEYARKAALYVLNTRSVEEALRIFTDGLEPVKRLRMRPEEEQLEEEEKENLQREKEEESGEQWDSSFGCFHYHMHGSSSGFRDIVTAPF